MSKYHFAFRGMEIFDPPTRKTDDSRAEPNCANDRRGAEVMVDGTQRPSAPRVITRKKKGPTVKMLKPGLKPELAVLSTLEQSFSRTVFHDLITPHRAYLFPHTPPAPFPVRSSTTSSTFKADLAIPFDSRKHRVVGPMGGRCDRVIKTKIDRQSCSQWSNQRCQTTRCQPRVKTG